MEPRQPGYPSHTMNAMPMPEEEELAVTFELGEFSNSNNNSLPSTSGASAASGRIGLANAAAPGSAGSSTRATTSPRGPLEWSTPLSSNSGSYYRRRHGAGAGGGAGGGGMDSGYQTDSPLMNVASSSASRTVAAGAAAAASNNNNSQWDSEQFRMSMEDLHLQLPSPSANQQQQQQQPPPGTFRPVSPQPVMLSASVPATAMRQLSPNLMMGTAHYNYQHYYGHYSSYYRPPSVPMADLPDADDYDDEAEAEDYPGAVDDQEVALVAAAAAAAARGTNQHQQPLPDVVMETTIVDIRFRSQSVPVMPETAEQLLRMQREQSVEQVANGLRRIGDEITSSRAVMHNRTEQFVFRRLRGYSVSGAEHQHQAHLSSGGGAASTGGASGGGGGGNGGGASSYPGDPLWLHGQAGQQARSQSWFGFASVAQLLRTISGVGISNEEADVDDYDASREVFEEDGDIN